ncbi:MAG: hypothetical protein KF752_17220 [Pirellulaceae bacterium]|nr:hypothetical protein [Pirellulaceae bacterium]
MQHTNPKHLLAIDAAGALTTCAITGLVLAPERLMTGLPPTLLYWLAGIAGGFFVLGMFGLSCAPDPRRPLKLLAMLNGGYCITTLVCCVAYWNQLTMWGGIYFVLEAIVISALVFWEWRVAGMPWLPAGNHHFAND